MHELARDQHGLITRQQARAAGLSPAAVRRRIDRGDLVAAGNQVLRVAAAPVTDRQRAMAAVLDAGHGAAVGLASAAALWRLPGFEVAPVHIVRLREGSRPPSSLAVVHTTTVLHAGHIALAAGIPTTTPARTLCDLAGVVHPGRVDWLFNKMWARRLLDPRQLEVVFRDLAGRGRDGVVTLRALLERYRHERQPTGSNIESRLRDLLARDGQPPMRRQVDLGDEGWIGRVDFVDSDHLVVVEVQSDLYHGSLLDQENDAVRRARLVATGWEVVEAWEDDVWHHPDEVVRRIRQARGRGRSPAHGGRPPEHGPGHPNTARDHAQDSAKSRRVGRG